MKINLKAPYPVNASVSHKLRASALFGSFVFLFLFIFKPFELGSLQHPSVFIFLGYGAITFFTMVMLNIVLIQLFPAYFKEKTWTAWKEITWSGLNVFLIGLGNYLFTIWLGFAPFKWNNLWLFQVYTMAIGVFPVTISILLNLVRLQTKFEHQSQELTQHIHEVPPVPMENSHTITIPNGAETVTLKVPNILFAQANDNYIEIHFLQHDSPTKLLVRNTLKAFHTQVQDYPEFLKCHRSYVVNLNQVQKISGNAQGYKLHLTNRAETIPVSRSLNDSIKNYFTNRP